MRPPRIPLTRRLISPSWRRRALRPVWSTGWWPGARPDEWDKRRRARRSGARSGERSSLMGVALDYAIPIVLGAVTVVLLLGLWNMIRGRDPGRSQQLMRWRVGLQFLAIVIVMAALYFGR